MTSFNHMAYNGELNYNLQELVARHAEVFQEISAQTLAGTVENPEGVDDFTGSIHDLTAQLKRIESAMGLIRGMMKENLGSLGQDRRISSDTALSRLSQIS